jgi:hypothetical protein
MTLQVAAACSPSPSSPAPADAGATAGLRAKAGKPPRRPRPGHAPACRGHPCRRQDLAFQKAMLRAIAAGREDPPMVGVCKDFRPFDAPRLFEPVPHSSGCTSPARECAELTTVDAVAALVPSTAVTPAGGHNSDEGDA